MSNTCGWTGTTIQDVIDRLCEVYVSVSTVQDTLETGIANLAADMGVINTNVIDVRTDLDGLKDWVGDPSGGPNVYDSIQTAISDILTVRTATTTIISNQASQNVSLAEINADVDEANDAIGIAGSKIPIIDAVQQGGTSVGQLLGSFAFALFGGGSSTVNVLGQLLSIWNAPPVDLLTASTPIALSASNDITINDGVYGYKLELTVAAWHGVFASDPLTYKPEIAVVGWSGAFGAVGPVVDVDRAVTQLYPIPSGSSTLHVLLRPGVTGDYRELRFL